MNKSWLLPDRWVIFLISSTICGLSVHHSSPVWAGVWAVVALLQFAVVRCELALLAIWLMLHANDPAVTGRRYFWYVPDVGGWRMAPMVLWGRVRGRFWCSHWRSLERNTFREFAAAYRRQVR